MRDMLPIKKGAPPQALTDAVHRIKSMPDTTLSWQQLDSGERAGVCGALIQEQGGLCAYCMRRIAVNNAHVEHIKPQSAGFGHNDPDSVDYANLLAVCDGFEGSQADLTCDRARGDRPLTINPTIPGTLEGIRYKRDGAIYSDDSTIDCDLKETLNLNQRLLLRNRSEALRSAYERLRVMGAKRGRASVAAFCKKYVEEHRMSAAARVPYDGIVVYFFERRSRAAG